MSNTNTSVDGEASQAVSKSKFQVGNMNLHYGTFHALKDIQMEIPANEITAFIGPSGCGKSTFLKSLNRMNDLVEGCTITGSVKLDGEDIYGNIDVNLLRKRVGMVFQNPDNQIVYNMVEDDVGFGPENLGVPTKEIWKRVEDALQKVGMLQARKESPNNLSGGQKQRVAIAGILAMHPKCIVLDESTAMLDPVGRREVLQAVRELNQKEHITVLWITHYMEEVVEADQVIVMNRGKIVMEGIPREIFSRVEQMQQYHLDVPQVTLLAHELRKRGMNLPSGVTRTEELVDAIARQFGK